MVQQATTKTGAKGRKIGRNSKKCNRYFLEGRREKNKARKVAKAKNRLWYLTESPQAGHRLIKRLQKQAAKSGKAS